MSHSAARIGHPAVPGAALACASPRPEIDPRAHGAVGDGQHDDTAGLQAALDAAAAMGGCLRLPAGTWCTGALFVRSGVHLHLAEGATLLGSPRLADYPLIDTRVAGIEMRWPAALLNIRDAHDVAISGPGTIDGQGAGFWAGYWALREAYTPRGLRWASDYDAQRPRLLLVQNACRVFIGGGLRLRRSGFWTLQLLYSQQVRVQDVSIRNNEDGHGPSTDGIDIDSSQRVLVRRVDIAVNDDAIAFKAGRDADGLRVARPTRDVLVADCTVREGATGVAFGSETSGGFERIRVRRLTVLPAVPVGVLLKSARTRGGWARDIRLTDLRCDGVAVPLRITLDWNPAYSRATLPEAERAGAPAHWLTLAAPVPPGAGLMQLHDLTVQRLRCHGARTAFEVDADARVPIGRLRLQQCDLQAEAGGHLLDVAALEVQHSRLRWAQPLVVHTPALQAALGAAPLAAAPAGAPGPQVAEPPAEPVTATLAPVRCDPDHPRRDVSTLPMHVQDVQ